MLKKTKVGNKKKVHRWIATMQIMTADLWLWNLNHRVTEPYSHMVNSLIWVLVKKYNYTGILYHVLTCLIN